MNLVRSTKIRLFTNEIVKVTYWVNQPGFYSKSNYIHESKVKSIWVRGEEIKFERSH